MPKVIKQFHVPHFWQTRYYRRNKKIRGTFFFLFLVVSLLRTVKVCVAGIPTSSYRRRESLILVGFYYLKLFQEQPSFVLFSSFSCSFFCQISHAQRHFLAKEGNCFLFLFCVTSAEKQEQRSFHFLNRTKLDNNFHQNTVQ